ncbi:MAG: hypothetical protein R6U00_08765 [Prochlorococcaceae cyanobacterium]
MPEAPTQFTSWTSLSDLERRLLFLSDGGGMNDVHLDLRALAGQSRFVALPMQALRRQQPT